jgi:Protein of unknown function (DUF2948)
MADARFEDGGETPLHLVARDAEDLGVIATLVQDAVFPITEMRYARGSRRFALLVNRFRWEDRDAARQAGRSYERVQALLVVDEALAVQTQGIDRTDRDMVLSLMSVTFEPGADGTGRVMLVLAGDGAIALQVEALEVTLKDVTRPYRAPSGKVPEHGD